MLKFRTLHLLCAAGLIAALATPGQSQTSSRLCSAGTRNGQACTTEADCPGGVCVVVQGVCDGGDDDGLDCDCPGSTCVDRPACSDDPTAGTCLAGAFPGDCCDVDFNCRSGAPCRGSQKICLDGDFKGFGCLKDADCDGAACDVTGKVCSADGFACVDNDDCITGTCRSAGMPTVTPTPTTTTPGPSPTPNGTLCIGNCDGDSEVTVDELVLMVNVALGIAPLERCPAGNPNGDLEITIEEIIAAVNGALNGCP